MFKIKTVSIDTESARKHVVKSLCKAKYRRIGSGAYGEVYGHPDSDKVYKIGCSNDNEGYLAFMDVLSKYRGTNPYMPKIYRMELVKGEDRYEDVFIVEMERLTKISRKEYDAVDWFASLMNQVEEGGNPFKAAAAFGLRMPKAFSEAIEILRKAYNRGNSGDQWSGVRFDLHTGNFMLRGTQMVCIDPLA